MRSVLGRALVLHSSAGTRIACGVIKPLAGGLVVKLGANELDLTIVRRRG